jgi:hypothetical protein
MTRLSQDEIAAIKALLVSEGELPPSFQQRLFPHEHVATRSDAPHVQHSTDYLSNALAQDEQVDIAALAQGDEIPIWRVPRLWRLAETLPIESVPVQDLLIHCESARWLSDQETVTVRALLNTHAVSWPPT